MFENAYFGKAYKTRGGDRALFQYKDSCQAHLFTEAEVIDVYLDGTIDSRFFDASLDIISEWQEPVDKEKMDAKSCAYTRHLELSSSKLRSYAKQYYKAGYKQGWEDKI